MFNMDYLLCQQVECAYEGFIGILDTTLELPLIILEQIKNVIKQLEVLIVNGIVKSAEDILGMIEDCLKIPDSVTDITDDFCEALLKCEFLWKSYLVGNPSDPYTWIKENICGSGLTDFLSDLKANFRLSMQGLANDVLGATGLLYVKEKIQDAIALYQEYLLKPIAEYFPFFPTLWKSLGIFNGVTKEDFDPEKSNIYDLIDFINQFANCVFSVCNLAESVTNKILDIEKKASIDVRARCYVPGKLELGIYQKLKDANDAVLRAQQSPCFF